jgi:hypothetical protein
MFDGDKELLWLEKCPRCDTMFAIYEVDGKPGEGHIRAIEKLTQAAETALILRGVKQEIFTQDYCTGCKWYMKWWGRRR